MPNCVPAFGSWAFIGVQRGRTLLLFPLALDIMPTELEAETSSGSIVMQLCDLSTLPSPLPVEFKTTRGKLSSDVTFTTVEDAAWEFQTVSGNVELLTVR